jgi:hypothetical protein
MHRTAAVAATYAALARLARSAALATAAFCATYGSAGAQPSQPSQSAAPRGEVVLVAPRAGVSIADLDRMLAPFGGTRERYMRELDVHVVRLPAGADARDVAAKLAQDPRVQYAQPDALRPLQREAPR